MSFGKGLLVTFGLAVGLAGVAAPASGATMNCTTGVCSDGTDNKLGGAVWVWTAAQPAGTGVIDSFVRIGTNGDVVYGNNQSARPVAYHEKTDGNYTRDITLGEVPLVNIDGKNYYEFYLDINQTGADPLLTLDYVRICTGGAGLSTTDNGGDKIGTTCPTGTTEVWKFGTAPDYNKVPTASNYDGGGHTVELNYFLNHGSGSGDLLMYVDATYFTGVSLGTNLYFFSMFGLPNSNNDGFEEWAVRRCGQTYNTGVLTCEQNQNLPGVPEPGSLVLMGAGLVGLAVAVRRRGRS